MDSVITFFMSIPFAALLFKLFIIVLSLLYVFYSILILGQTIALRKTVITEHGTQIQFISTAQLVVALAVFIVSLIY